jgi:hypothetical protein
MEGAWQVADAHHIAAATAIGRRNGFMFCDEIRHAQRVRVRFLTGKSILGRGIDSPSRGGMRIAREDLTFLNPNSEIMGAGA